MKTAMSRQGAERGAAAEQVLVVSPSPLLQKRLGEVLEGAGYRAQANAHVKEFLRSQRQRPFLACFLDTRSQEEAELLAACLKARPAERYILVRDGRPPKNGSGAEERPEVFGYLREHFTPEEVETWCRRAATEARLLQGDKSLDDLLYERFRAFLQNLGPAPMTRLHDLVSERVERPLITAVLEWTGGNQSKAAEILGVHRNTLRTKIRTLGLTPPR